VKSFIPNEDLRYKHENTLTIVRGNVHSVQIDRPFTGDFFVLHGVGKMMQGRNTPTSAPLFRTRYLPGVFAQRMVSLVIYHALGKL
jgi:hypothetical protein